MKALDSKETKTISGGQNFDEYEVESMAALLTTFAIAVKEANAHSTSWDTLCSFCSVLQLLNIQPRHKHLQAFTQVQKCHAGKYSKRVDLQDCA
jgi:hypothetical protein